MSETLKLNLDTSVLFNYLYSTILPSNTDGESKFEEDKGCREYFDSNQVYLVAGGKVTSELLNACDRLYELYEDIVDYMEENNAAIASYDASKRGFKNSNDESHVRKLKVQFLTMSVVDQLSMIRFAHQELDVCCNDVMAHLDKDFEQFEDDFLRNEFEEELDVEHDCDVLVDAAYIARDHGISTLAAVDSDITDHQDEVNDIIRDKFDLTVTIVIIDPQNHKLN